MTAPNTAIVSRDLRTSSLIIADKFEKLHKNVIRDIRQLEVPDEFNRLNFEPVEYEDCKGETRPSYNITRDGFVILVMGFTGAKAMHWKLKFLEAFNRMEAELRFRDATDPTSRGSQNYIYDPFEDVGSDKMNDILSLIREARLVHGKNAAKSIWNRVGLPIFVEPILLSAPDNGDTMDRFVNQALIVTGDANDKAYSSDLYAAYTTWQQREGAPCLNSATFFKRFALQAGNIFYGPHGVAKFEKSKSDTSLYRGLEIHGDYIREDMVMFQ